MASPAHDPYCYPGSRTLKNQIGTEDEAAVQAAELEVSQWEEILLRENLLEGEFDLAHLQKIHQRLFGKIYPWAGEIRCTDIAKGPTLFAKYQFIESYAKDVFDAFNQARKHWSPERPPKKLLKNLADLLGEINALHPFREGNGRTQRLFIGQLAKTYGTEIDWSKTNQEEMRKASIEAMTGKTEGLEKILQTCSTPIIEKKEKEPGPEPKL